MCCRKQSSGEKIIPNLSGQTKYLYFFKMEPRGGDPFSIESMEHESVLYTLNRLLLKVSTEVAVLIDILQQEVPVKL